MVAALFYAEIVPVVGELAVVDGDEGFHAATVRRIRAGESLLISDGAGAIAECIVENVDRRTLTARVTARRAASRPTPVVTVVQAIPKSERSELAVELSTEAGADAFIAWQAERCVARWDGDRAAKGLRRWQAVARSAARSPGGPGSRESTGRYRRPSCARCSPNGPPPVSWPWYFTSRPTSRWRIFLWRRLNRSS